ncbi:N-acetylmuramoyl-L-alanine amidase-like domain-containing protein [Legionella spiritensis]|uniref:N-acetylmuramoyl-L-alanine amidase-like domain-containing protein n=1 Tax=Legionella spiritensis TaxID=452 RepID=UPI000F6C3D9D|nr:N-acetylmuramoyl-L-alanine amidase-like domain-containing protein [Legionella spiritensis]VEG91898.1 Protein of uncharacterised function (DUF1460) [Legionella spiritensis]
MSSLHLRTVGIGLLICFIGLNHAGQTSEQQADTTLKSLYHSINNIPNHDMSARLEVISAQFLGKPYLLGALGEGKNARYDQSPLYRTDAFDCETFVTTILAIALADDSLTFQHCLRQLRYNQGQCRFLQRNHFTGLDWNQNNQKQGFVKDITMSITDANQNVVAQTASAMIDKPSWYQHFTTDNVKLAKPDHKEQMKRLTELKKKGSTLQRTRSTLPYLPLSALFNKKGQANQHLFSRIPNGAIIEIVRPNWDLTRQIGTHLNVSHLGFVFRKNDSLIFRHASSQSDGVVDVSLIDYLRNALTSPTIKGINVQIVVPKKPLSGDCKPLLGISRLPVSKQQ